MVDREKALGIIDGFLADVLVQEPWYKNIELEIKAILLYGSVAKGANSEDSDIDILIILPLAEEQKHTKGEYVYKYRGHEINIVIRSIERLRKISESNDDERQREVFQDSVIISSADDEVKNLLERLK